MIVIDFSIPELKHTIVSSFQTLQISMYYVVVCNISRSSANWTWGRAEILQGKVLGWLKQRKYQWREDRIIGNEVLSDSRRELGGEIDCFALVIFGGRNIHCGQHCHNGRPHRGVSNVSAWLKNALVHHMLMSLGWIDPPGHIRRPRPKMYCTGSSSVSAPLMSMNLSGIKWHASGYRFSSCEMALKLGFVIFHWRLSRIYLTISCTWRSLLMYNI